MKKNNDDFEFIMEPASREQYEEDIKRSRKNRGMGNNKSSHLHLDMIEIRYRERMFPDRKISRRVRVGNQIVVGPE